MTRIALWQGPAGGGEPDVVLPALLEVAVAAAGRGARLLVTPEMSLTGYDIGTRTQDLAEPADGPLRDRVAAIAGQAGLAVSYGYPERAAEGIYNATQVVGADGSVLARYRKTHLFGDLDRGQFLPGDELVVQFDLEDLRVGLLTCYDVEFPETVRAHALAGTQLLVVPTGLMHPFGFVSTTLVPARAYESQVFVAYANRCDVEGSLDYCGLSCVVAPDLTELARAGEGEELLVVHVDPLLLHESRVVNTHLEDRRPDLYGGGAR